MASQEQRVTCLCQIKGIAMNKYFKQHRGKFVLAVMAIVLLLPLLFSRPWLDFIPKYDEFTAHVGDTIGGITAPFVGLLSAWLVYEALLAQIAANKFTSDQFVITQHMKTIEFLFDKFENSVTNFKFNKWPRVYGESQYRNFSEFMDLAQIPNVFFENSSNDDERRMKLLIETSRGIELKGTEAFFESLVRIIVPVFGFFHPADNANLDKDLSGLTRILEQAHNLISEIDRIKDEFSKNRLITASQFKVYRDLTEQVIRDVVFQGGGIDYQIDKNRRCEKCHVDHVLPDNFYAALLKLQESLKSSRTPMP
jgi:hypothetical protein